MSATKDGYVLTAFRLDDGTPLDPDVLVANVEVEVWEIVHKFERRGKWHESRWTYTTEGGARGRVISLVSTAHRKHHSPALDNLLYEVQSMSFNDMTSASPIGFPTPEGGGFIRANRSTTWSRKETKV